jgi:hypothetical protein
MKVWCGLEVSLGKSASKTIKVCKVVFQSKFGGNVLGFAELQQADEDQEAFLLRLKVQASKLMPHGLGLPSKFVSLDVIDNIAFVHWDEAQAKATFDEKFQVEKLEGAVESVAISVRVPKGCKKVWPVLAQAGAVKVWSKEFCRTGVVNIATCVAYQRCPDWL